MRLDFNVLWVDDQPGRVAAQIDAITKRMEEEGFLFNAKLCRSVQEVQAAIRDDVFTDEVDLILVDWDLGGQIVGQDAIAEIRTSVPYKDVVFYSAQTVPEELRKLAFGKGLEGVYCANREHLVDEVMGVFESLVKKVLDLDHTRGIVMGATSDIDHIVNECLTVIHDKSDATGRAGLLKKAQGYVDKRMKEVAKMAEDLGKATTVTELFEAHIILTANDRLRMLGGALKSGTFAAHKGYRQKVINYQKDVVPDRNRLGHMVLVPEGKPQAVVDSKGQQVTVQGTRELRRLILQLRTDFRNLLTALEAHGVVPPAGPRPGGAQ